MLEQILKLFNAFKDPKTQLILAASCFVSYILWNELKTQRSESDKMKSEIYNTCAERLINCEEGRLIDNRICNQRIDSLSNSYLNLLKEVNTIKSKLQWEK